MAQNNEGVMFCIKKILTFLYVEPNSHFYIKICTSSHFQEWIHMAVVSN